MQIYVTRTKIFLSSQMIELDDPATGEKVKAEKELRFFAAAENPPKIVEAPDWIAETLTFKVGIRDKSIVNMTPPAVARTSARELVATDDEDAKAKAAAAEAKAAEEKAAAEAKAKADAEADAAKKASKTGLQK